MLGEEDERVRSESEVGDEEQERERLVFMLLVTEVFIAPPTHG